MRPQHSNEMKFFGAENHTNLRTVQRIGCSKGHIHNTKKEIWEHKVPRFPFVILSYLPIYHRGNNIQ